jgi:hypothetical protein
MEKRVRSEVWAGASQGNLVWLSAEASSACSLRCAWHRGWTGTLMRSAPFVLHRDPSAFVPCEPQLICFPSSLEPGNHRPLYLLLLMLGELLVLVLIACGGALFLVFRAQHKWQYVRFPLRAARNRWLITSFLCASDVGCAKWRLSIVACFVTFSRKPIGFPPLTLPPSFFLHF